MRFPLELRSLLNRDWVVQPSSLAFVYSWDELAICFFSDDDAFWDDTLRFVCLACLVTSDA